MTHEEALDVLTAWIVAGGRGHPTSPERRGAAEDHVSRCRGCWDELCATHELIVGSRPEKADRMHELFGCAATQEQLYALVGLTPAGIEEQHPHLARHLTWCHACREHLTELVEMNEFTAAPHKTETLLKVVERLVVTIREGIARFSELPDHLFATSLVAAAGASRGDSKGSSRASAGERVTLDIGSSGLKIDVAIEPQESGRLRLSLSLSGREAGPIDVGLREVRGSNETLIKEQSPIKDRSFVADGLRPGCYALHIHDTVTNERSRIQLDIDANTN